MSKIEKSEWESLIEPALSSNGWTWDTQLRIEAEPQQRPAEAVLVDYLLRFHQMPLAVLETAPDQKRLPEALRQAEAFAAKLDLRFAIASNGTHYLIRDIETRSKRAQPTPPAPEEILAALGTSIDWGRWTPTFETPWLLEDSDPPVRAPRLAGEIAVFSTLSLLASSAHHVLLTMPQGTEKTLALLQLCWKLLRGGALPQRRILVVTHRTVYREQTRMALSRIPQFKTMSLERNSVADETYRSANILVANFQTLVNGPSDKRLYKRLGRADFDLIVNLDLHLAPKLAWKSILEHFPNAYHIGLASTDLSHSSAAFEYFDIFTRETGGKPAFTPGAATAKRPFTDFLAHTRFETMPEFAGAYAIFVLLKIAEDEHPSLFPQEIRRSRLLMQTPENLPQYLLNRVLPALEKISHPDLSYLRLLPSLFKPEKLEAPVVLVALTRVADEDVADLKVRRRLTQEFESYVREWFGRARISEGSNTPDELAFCLVDILQPRENESVYDPCSGVGNLLRHVAARQSELGQPVRQRDSKLNLYGCDPNPTLCLLSLARLALVGDVDLHLQCRHAFTHDDSMQLYDCILANLPAGQQEYEFPRGPLPDAPDTLQAAFLVHILTHLAPGGRAAVIVPDTLLFREPDRYLRQHLLANYRLEAVIALPERLFKGYTSLSTSLLVVRRQTPAKSVLFVSRDFTFRVFARTPSQAHLRRLLLSALHFHLGTDPNLAAFSAAWADLQAVLEQNNLATPRQTGRQVSGDAFACALDLAITIPELRLALEGPSGATSEGKESDALKASLRGARLVKSAWRTPVSDLNSGNCDLIARDPGTQALNNLIAHFESEGQKVRVRKLSELAEVYSGMRANPKTIFHYRDVAPEGGYNNVITARDLQPTIHESGASRWCGPEVYEKVDDKYCLRLKDILTPSFGTVGTVAIYKDDFVQHPYEDLIVIRVTDDAILPEYLWRLLQTEPYQVWIKGHATGGTVQRLYARVLAQVPIPIPDFEFQQQVIHNFKGRERFDTLLTALTTPHVAGPSLRMLSDAPSAVALAAMSDAEISLQACLPVLKELIAKCREWNQEMHKELEQESRVIYLYNWLDAWQQVLSGLPEILEMPAGADRLIALQSWERQASTSETVDPRRVREIRKQMEDLYPGVQSSLHALEAAFELAQRIVARLSTLALAECTRMLDNTPVSASITPTIIPVHTESELTGSLRNDGLFTLRNVAAFIPGIEKSGGVATVLLPGQALNWSFKLKPERLGTTHIEIAWFASRLDAQISDGKLDLAVEARPSADLAASPILDKTPYIVGPYITGDRQEMFKGRQQIIDEIKRSLRADGPSTVFVMEGNRRLGKSSLLIHLQQAAVLPGWIPAYLSFQRGDGAAQKDGMTTETIFYLIAKVLLDASRVEGTQISIPNCGDVPYCVGRQPTGQETLAFSAFAMRNLRPVFSAANPFECLQLVVESILAAIGKRRILLMLDEFDKLQVGIDTGATSPLVPENLRNLFHTYPQVSGILAGSRRMRELRNQYFNALFGLGKSLRVSSLDAASATQLITDPVKGKLVYTPQAVEFILRETACQPFLLQGVCDQVFSLCSTSAADRAVTLTIAERAAGVFSQDNEHFSQVWFDDVKTDLRHFTLCLIDTYTGGPDPLTAEFIFTQLERSGIGRVDLKQLGDDLDELAGLEVLVHDREGLQTTYRINIPLLSRWMRQNIDFGRYKLAAKMETE